MRFKANIYKDRITRWNSGFQTLENGYLWASYKSGDYSTKIKPNDLPNHYVPVYLSGQTQYISTKVIKHLLYKPNYIFNHMFKDDFLYVSYDKNIVAIEDELGRHIEGEDFMLWGSAQYEFIEAIESQYNVSKIKQAMDDKIAWHEAGNGNPNPDFTKNKLFVKIDFE